MTATAMTKELTAREYLRVSQDKSGRERSLEEQRGENAATAQTHGWTLGEPYRDVGSASRHAVKARDGFARLIDDLDHDRFGADVLILWESSRGSRRVWEWARLIDLCEERGVLIAVTSHGRVYDPGDGRDRRSMHEDATDSEYESDKVSKRVRRAAKAGAEAGRPHGQAPFGYRAVYDSKSGRLDRWELEPSEAPMMIDAYKRIAAGHSLRAVAADLAGDGMVGRRGRPITPATLRPMLLSNTYRGTREHAPGSRGRSDRRGCDITLYEAAWPALVDEATWLAVHTRLSDPKRRTSRPGRGKHLLSMIARCDTCGGPISARFSRGERQYQCAAGHVRLSADELDELVAGDVLDWLSQPENVALLAPADDGSELAAARDRLAAIRAEHADLVDRVGRGELSATLAAAAEPAILARLEATQRVVDEMSAPSALSGLLSGGDVRRSWQEAPMSTRREVMRLLLRLDWVGELRVKPGVRGHRIPVRDRVEYR